MLPWSSGYDARLTRERSPVQSREEVCSCDCWWKQRPFPKRENILIARLAQLVERQPFKLVVVGSSPTVGALDACFFA